MCNIFKKLIQLYFKRTHIAFSWNYLIVILYITILIRQESNMHKWSNMHKDAFAQRDIFARLQFCTILHLHKGSILHGLKNFIFLIYYYSIFTVTITPNPYLRLVSYFILHFLYFFLLSLLPLTLTLGRQLFFLL